MTEEKKQVHSSIPLSLVDRIEHYAEKEKKNCSAMIAILLKEAVNKRDKK
jgi:hypothetical protein